MCINGFNFHFWYSFYPAPAMGNVSSVHRLSLFKWFSKSFREMRASASTKPPAMAAMPFPSTPCNCQTKTVGILNQCFKLLSNVLMSLVTVIQLRISYCSSNSSQRVFPGCGNQLPRLIFHHWLSKPLSLKPIISKPAKFEQKAVQQ